MAEPTPSPVSRSPHRSATLTALGAGVTITIDEVAAGTVALNGPEGALSSSAPGMALGNLNFRLYRWYAYGSRFQGDDNDSCRVDTRLPR